MATTIEGDAILHNTGKYVGEYHLLSANASKSFTMERAAIVFIQTANATYGLYLVDPSGNKTKINGNVGDSFITISGTTVTITNPNSWNNPCIIWLM